MAGCMNLCFCCHGWSLSISFSRLLHESSPRSLPEPRQAQQHVPAMLPIPSAEESLPMLPIRAQQDAPPILPIPSAEKSMPMLPIPTMPTRGTHPDEGYSGIQQHIPLMLPISSSKGSLPMLPTDCYMTGIFSNQSQGSWDLPQDTSHFVTPTISTISTLRSSGGKSSRKPVPVPISRSGSDASSAYVVGCSTMVATMSTASGVSMATSNSLPRWARSYAHTSQEDTSNNKGRSSISSVSDMIIKRRSSLISVTEVMMQSTNSIWSTSTISPSKSVSWAPEVFVHCWHRKLSETYQDYDMVDFVGEGRSAAVFIVQSKRSEQRYACKVLKKADQDMNTINSEIQALRRLDHPNIVRLYETNEDVESVFLIMELCLGGDLFARIIDAGQLSENHSCIFAHQMLSALAYCHSVGFVHRDVKPENFLLETDSPDCLCLKLADFGVASSMRPANLSSTLRVGDGNWYGDGDLPSFIANNQQSGSLPYMAPEILNGDWTSILKDVGASVRLFAASDLWSTGVVIYVMRCGCLPFGADAEMICSGHPPDFSAEVWSETSDEAISLICGLVTPNLVERWSAKQALWHEWFQSQSISASSFAQSPKSLGDDGSAIRGELAIMLLESLRRWEQTHKLRRIMITAIAKKLESNHETNKVATTAFKIFSDNSAVLKCEDLVKELEITAALGQESSSLRFFSPLSPVSELDCGSELDTPAHCRRSSGQQGRQRVTRRRLTMVKEEPGSTAHMRSQLAAPGDEPIDLPELRLLTSSLDTKKNGSVDYTVLVAALLAPEVYCDEVRIAEVFDLFDFQKRGKIAPSDVRTVMGSNSVLKDFKDMLSEFDADGDGMLDMHEFQAMVQWESDCNTKPEYSRVVTV